MKLPDSTSQRLKHQLDCLPTILAGIRPDALGQKLGPGKWSARENLAHLARYQDVYINRLSLIESRNRPTLPRYRAEEDLN